MWENRNSRRLHNLLKVSQLRMGQLEFELDYCNQSQCSTFCSTYPFFYSANSINIWVSHTSQVLLVWEAYSAGARESLPIGSWLRSETLQGSQELSSRVPFHQLRITGLGAIPGRGTQGTHCAWLQILWGAKCILESSFYHIHKWITEGTEQQWLQQEASQRLASSPVITVTSMVMERCLAFMAALIRENTRRGPTKAPEFWMWPCVTVGSGSHFSSKHLSFMAQRWGRRPHRPPFMSERLHPLTPRMSWMWTQCSKEMKTWGFQSEQFGRRQDLCL